ncbi:beta-propeller domain-containing protein [Neobacillus sp. LXY-4]|uniref:beta-propeller domain-containing protein n=1 Tax=Neobacillus sp. LXY-4 TaxID=3379826 RepID=UPI003EDEC194
MRKIWVMFGSLCVAVFILFFYKTELKIENEWRDNEQQIVLANKVWKIHFSEKIHKSSVNSNLIYVTNDKGKKLTNELFLSDDQKTIYLTPPENGYAFKKSAYTLHIEKGIKSTLGRSLISSKKISFLVKETLPVVGSKTELNNYFLKIMDEQKQKTSLFGFSENSSESKSSDLAKSDSAAKQDHSETNVQVQGVDEADIVKTDGNLIYMASSNKVEVIKAVPAQEMQRLATISYDEAFSPLQLFLHKDQLLVIGSSYQHYDQQLNQSAATIKIAPMYQSTKAIVYNVKNPSKPEKVREISLEGAYVSSRKIDGLVYLVTNHYPDFWILEKNKDIDIRPKYSDSAVSSETKLVNYKEIQYFPDSKESNYTMIAAFDLEQPNQEAKITTYLGSGSQLYMSKKNLYLAVPNQFIQPLAADISEMTAPDTNIYKFSVNGLEVNFHSSTEIEGTILNQFSMDEHEGYFRLVTTKGFPWDSRQPSTNQLFIFDENLKQVGELKELAKGEKIYSARFLGDRIYMVTFKQTDPLFVIDASEPSQPKVLGELKIPGFSNYLHPYDENHIIGFGQDTKVIDEKGANGEPRILTNGVKITMFDVSDMTNPKEKFTEFIGGRGTYSPLNYDHKALLFNKNTNLFAFPIAVYQSDPNDEWGQLFEFQGAYVYNLDPDKGFTLKSKITHETTTVQPYESWENSIQRLVYIGDTLYALSDSKISAHNLKSSEQISELSLKK